jgi:hypothetical protein
VAVAKNGLRGVNLPKTHSNVASGEKAKEYRTFGLLTDRATMWELHETSDHPQRFHSNCTVKTGRDRVKKHQYTASVIINEKKIQLHLNVGGKSTLHDFVSIESLNRFLGYMDLPPLSFEKA